MFDRALQRRLAPFVTRLAAGALALGLTADRLTGLGLLLGLGGAGLVAAGAGAGALGCLLLSRLADGLDGAAARLTRPTPRGAFLDIVADFAVYGAYPLAFALREPGANALPAAFLLFTFYVNGASFLAFAATAPAGMRVPGRGEKGLLYTAGLAEGAETILVLALMVLFPGAFPALAWGFGALCLLTAGSRVVLALRLLGPGGR